MPLIRVTLTDKQYAHIDKLADAAQVEHGAIVRTLIDLDLEGGTNVPEKVMELLEDLYAVVKGNAAAKKVLAEKVPTSIVQLKNRKGTILTPEQDEAILTMRKQGHTYREIEEYFGIGHGTVYRAVARANKR